MSGVVVAQLTHDNETDSPMIDIVRGEAPGTVCLLVENGDRLVFDYVELVANLAAAIADNAGD